MWTSFCKKYPCTFDLIAYSIGIIAGVFIWAVFHSSEYAFLLAIFGGGTIVSKLYGQKTTWWPKSVEQKAKDGEKYLPKYIKRQRGIPFKEE